MTDNTSTQTTLAYRGFAITVTPLKDHDDLWDFEYTIAREGEGEAAKVSTASAPRSHTLGGHANAGIAAVSGLEVAKTEVDNLLALEQK